MSKCILDFVLVIGWCREKNKSNQALHTMDTARRHSASSSSSTELEKGMQEIGLVDRADEESNSTTAPLAHTNHSPASAFGRAYDSFAANDGGSSNHSNELSQSAHVDEPRSIASTTNNAEATSLTQGSVQTNPDLGASGFGAASYLSHRQLPTKNSSSSASVLKGPEEDRKPAAIDNSSNSHGDMCMPGPHPSAASAVAEAASLEPRANNSANPGNGASQEENVDACSESKPEEPAPVAAAAARSPKKKRAAKSNKKAGGGGDESHSTGRWTDAEHQAFLRGLHMYGREWKKVASHIPTRTSAQVRSHAQKYFTKMQRDQDAFLILSSSGAQNNGQVPAANESQPGVASATGTDNNAAESVPGLIPGLTPSMQSTVSRILSNPESVEAEVEDTLQRLRERYSQLQQRLEQTEQASARAELIPSEPNRLQGRKRPAEQDVAASSGSTATSLSSQQQQQLQDEELIALSVLQGALPRSGGSSAGSSHTDTASEELGNNTSNCSNAEDEDDDDTTLTNASTSSNKRTKTCDSSL